MVITNWAAPLAALLRLCKTATTSLDPRAQPPRGCCLNRRPKSLLKLAKSSDDRLHTLSAMVVFAGRGSSGPLPGIAQ
jgi:hypothetical protein